jgi:hypothetical protein
MKTKLLDRNNLTQLLCCLTFMLLFANTAMGQAQATFTWKTTGGADNNWANAANWTKSGTATGTGSTDTYPGQTPGRRFDIAIVATGATAVTPNIPARVDAYSLYRLDISNSATVPAGAVVTVSSGATVNIGDQNSNQLRLSGGTLINNGAVNISTTGAGFSGFPATGIICQTPVAIPSVPTEYGYKGTGTLSISLPNANFANAAFIYSNGTSTNANAVNATYRIELNNPTLSYNQATTLAIGAIRTIGIVAANFAPKLLISGTGFTVGSVASPYLGSLIGLGSGTSLTIDTGTNITFHSKNTNTFSGITSFHAAASTIRFTNNGTINYLGASARSGIGLSSGSTNNASVFDIVNAGTLNIDLNCATVGASPLNIGNGGGGAANAGTKVDITNTGTMTFKNTATTVGTGAAIYCVTASEAAPLNLINSGTLNIDGTSYTYAPKATITNSNIINSNCELRGFASINNNAVSTINFIKNAATATTRLVSFNGVAVSAAASMGAIYTDGVNQYTVMVQKYNTFGVDLITSVLSSADLSGLSATSGTLTKVSGTGSDTIAYNVTVAVIDPPALAIDSYSAAPLESALPSPTENLGTINTGNATNLNVIRGITATSTGIIDPGTNTGKGIVDFYNVDPYLALSSRLSMQIAAAETAGVDYDQFTNSAIGGGFNLAGATLNVTNIYTPTAYTEIDIITTSSGVITGTFGTINPALPAGWAVVYLADKVQLTYSIKPDKIFDFCKGAKVSDLLAATKTGIKAYAAVTGGVALTDAALKGTATLPAAYFVSEPTLSGGESPRVRVFVRVNALPATPTTVVLTNDNAVLPATSSTAVTAVGVFVGTNTPFKLTANAVAAASYIWTLPAGVERTDSTGIATNASTTSTDAFIYVKFTGTGVATPVVINVQSVNASGCVSAIKGVSITRLLPTAPAAIAIHDLSLPLPVSGIPTAVKSFAKYMGTDAVLTITASPTPTATSYEWELPEGVNQLSGGTTNVITVNFAGVTSANTYNFSTTAAVPVSTNVLRIGVKSVNGVGISTTANTALVNPVTSSTAKLLTLTAVAPAAPTLKMFDTAVSSTTAVTDISRYIGTSRPLTLVGTVAATTLASSFTWELPAGVNVVPGSVLSSNTIMVNFEDVESGVALLYLGVKAANGVGSSVKDNSKLIPATNSTATLLALKAVRPAAPKLIMLDLAVSSTLAVTDISKYIGTNTPLTLVGTVSATSVATSFNWEIPTTVNVVSGSDLSSNTIQVNFANYPAGVALSYIGIKAVNGFGASVVDNSKLVPATASTATLLKLAAGLPSAAGVVVGPLAICSNQASSVTYTITVAATKAKSYVITAPLGTTITGGTDNTITINAGAGATFTVNYPNGFTSDKTSPKTISIQSTNGFGVSLPKVLKLTSNTCTTAARTAKVAQLSTDFKVIAYPNPSTSVFNLAIESSKVTSKTIQVYDMQGRMIENKQVNTNEVSIGANYPSGVYNVIVTQDANIKTLRVIKQ